MTNPTDNVPSPDSEEVQPLDTLETVLLILRKDNQIMLAEKKRGFGKGKFDGVGGKIESGESSEQAMLRECYEEVGVTPIDYCKVGRNECIEYVNGERKRVFLDIYLATAWSGEPTESEEMKPLWFAIDDLPYERMFEDERYWLPHVLDGKKVAGYFEFDENWNMLDHRVEVSDE